MTLPWSCSLLCCRWYRSLCPRRDAWSWQFGPVGISPQMRVTPYLLRMKWNGYPLHWREKMGWGYLIPASGHTPQEGSENCRCFSYTLMLVHLYNVHVCICTYMYMYVYVYTMYMYVYVYTMYMYVYVCICINDVYVCICIYNGYVSTYMYMYVYVHTCTCMFNSRT